jgi:hypothetical protein
MSHVRPRVVFIIALLLLLAIKFLPFAGFEIEPQPDGRSLGTIMTAHQLKLSPTMHLTTTGGIIQTWASPDALLPEQRSLIGGRMKALKTLILLVTALSP